jgi:hypothetical protein
MDPAVRLPRQKVKANALGLTPISNEEPVHAPSNPAKFRRAQAPERARVRWSGTSADLNENKLAPDFEDEIDLPSFPTVAERQADPALVLLEPTPSLLLFFKTKGISPKLPGLHSLSLVQVVFPC